MGLAEAGKDREQFKVEIVPAITKVSYFSPFVLKPDPCQLDLQAAVSKKDYTAAKRLLSKLKAGAALLYYQRDSFGQVSIFVQPGPF